MMPLHDEPCMWPQVACTCPPQEAVCQNAQHMMTHEGYGNGLNIRRPAWWTCRCSACVLQRQEKLDQYRDNEANGHL